MGVFFCCLSRFTRNKHKPCRCRQCARVEYRRQVGYDEENRYEWENICLEMKTNQSGALLWHEKYCFVCRCLMKFLLDIKNINNMLALLSPTHWIVSTIRFIMAHIYTRSSWRLCERSEIWDFCFFSVYQRKTFPTSHTYINFSPYSIYPPRPHTHPWELLILIFETAEWCSSRLGTFFKRSDIFPEKNFEFHFRFSPFLIFIQIFFFSCRVVFAYIYKPSQNSQHTSSPVVLGSVRKRQEYVYKHTKRWQRLFQGRRKTRKSGGKKHFSSSPKKINEKAIIPSFVEPCWCQ